MQSNVVYCELLPTVSLSLSNSEGRDKGDATSQRHVLAFTRQAVDSITIGHMLSAGETSSTYHFNVKIAYVTQITYLAIK